MASKGISATDPVLRTALVTIFCVVALAAVARADDRPYLVTYNHDLEDAGDLEICFISTLAFSHQAGRLANASLEIEYGITPWWTTELYLAGQSRLNESTVFTGYEWENRFRLLRGRHWINPVLYFEFESGTSTDRPAGEVVGKRESERHEVRREREREIETRLILSSNTRGWNVSENLITVKNLSSEPWKFGYAIAASRPLSMAGSRESCNRCLRNLHAGIEVYGGLGDWHSFGLSNTFHYVAPVFSWELRDELILRVSPSFGVTRGSYPFILAFGLSYDVADVGSRIRTLLR